MDTNLTQTPLNVAIPNIPRVLAVDDHKDSLILIAQVLDSLNCVFALASTGQQAFRIARDYQPDLILLDIVLPDVSGLELVTRFRREPSTAKAKLVAVTGLAFERDRTRLLAAGCSSYLAKPYLLDDLRLTLCEHLGSIDRSSAPIEFQRPLA